MTTVTYGTQVPALASETERKGLFLRLLDAIAESRMRKAEREISRLRRFLPEQ